MRRQPATDRVWVRLSHQHVNDSFPLSVALLPALPSVSELVSRLLRLGYFPNMALNDVADVLWLEAPEGQRTLSLDTRVASVNIEGGHHLVLNTLEATATAAAETTLQTHGQQLQQLARVLPALASLPVPCPSAAVRAHHRVPSVRCTSLERVDHDVHGQLESGSSTAFFSSSSDYVSHPAPSLPSRHRSVDFSSLKAAHLQHSSSSVWKWPLLRTALLIAAASLVLLFAVNWLRSRSGSEGGWQGVSLPVLQLPSSPLNAAARRPLNASAAPSLVLVIPLVTEDIPPLLRVIETWASLGPACSLAGRELALPSLVFFYAGSRLLYEGRELNDTLAAMGGAVQQNVLPCFASVRTMYAELAPELHGQPEGQSSMFFKLMLQLATVQLRSFSHMYWMEWDVQPVRGYWLDALSALLLSEPFWMKGGRYRGRAFDELVHRDPASWMWVGHLNGNALYALHDAEFRRFLELVMEREPPSQFRKPFDIAIWKTLHDLPYSWHLYQVHGDKFQTTAVIRHLGFTMGSPELSELVASSPQIHLVHGESGSAGSYEYDRKSVGILPRSNGTALWRDEVTASMRVSLLLRTTASELPSAALMLASAQRYFPGAFEYAVVVPQQELQAVQDALPPYVTVHAESRQPELQSERQQQLWSSLHADQYTRGDYVFHVSADTVFFRPVLQRDLFIFHKPILSFDRYGDVKQPAAGRDEQQQLQAGLSAALQQPVTVDVSQSGRHFLYPRKVYVLARQRLQAVHNGSVAAFVASACTSWPSRLFDSLRFLGSFLYSFHPELMSWTYRGSQTAPEHSLSYAYTSLLPQLSCQGDSRWATLPGYEAQYETQLDIMRRIADGLNSNCGELNGYVAAHSPAAALQPTAD